MVHAGRSIEDIQRCAEQPKETYSVKNAPLPIELDHVAPDELHILLRIMDILIENLITQAVELDIKATRKKHDPLSGATLQKLQGMIQSCGVSFQIWKKKDNSNTLDWISLGRADKRKVLSQLPGHLPKILPPNSSLCITQLR